MRQIGTFFRVFGMIILVTVFLTHMSIVWLLVRERWRRVRSSNRILSHYCKVGLWIMRIKVNPVGLENLSHIRGGLFAGNHLGYTDVLAISSQATTCFVTSQEIRQTPVLGQICKLAGCLFVERRNKHNIMNDIGEIGGGLQVGLHVAIFPEATSTNGENIVRFRKPLFKSAIDSGRPVIPFCLNYRTVGGKTINRNTRDTIFWYGDMPFGAHLWALCGNGGVTVDLHFLKPLETEHKMDVTALTERAQAAVESVFLPVSD
jgi:lyso-ornithine lipid O-acyltransferase